MQLQTIPAAQTMTSREISDLTGKNHPDVMRDIRVMVDQLTKADLLSCAISNTYAGKDGRQYPQYELDKDTCLNLLLGYDPVARMKVVKRWQELEAAQAPKLPQTMAQALRLAAEQAELLELQAEQLALAAPKAEFVDRYVQAATGSKSFRQVAKLLQANEHEFRAWLQDKKVMYKLGREWAPHANHLDAGRFEVKAGVAEHGEKSHAYSSTLFTSKGVSWVAGEWAKHKLALATAKEGSAC